MPPLKRKSRHEDDARKLQPSRDVKSCKAHHSRFFPSFNFTAAGNAMQAVCEQQLREWGPFRGRGRPVLQLTGMGASERPGGPISHGACT